MSRTRVESINRAPADGTKSAALITGGAGFIGSNLAYRLLSEGRPVRILDNLARPGVERNLARLAGEFGALLQIEQADITKVDLRRLVRGVGEVYHFSAQVAVTTSLENPALDFETNVRGTVNLLEALRAQPEPPKLVFTSTNKVYGSLEDVAMRRVGDRYEPAEEEYRAGISEARPLDFHTPYGCSKGAADQYVIDYARSYGMPTAVFRMSCIYGPRQCGTEDQGWVAHFLMRALAGEPITIYGDGMQVRDILYIDDLLQAFRLVMDNLPRLRGQAFNIGGGNTHTVSLIEVLQSIGEIAGTKPRLQYADWRQGDQKYYVSDTRKFQHATGWQPSITIREGLSRLHGWLERDQTRPHALLTAQS